ncbi:MAG: polysaccharide biosynthesis protein [Clostridia bacterium]|nr:polysaccharide biosynthesis protein [Clostridia bacterium]
MKKVAMNLGLLARQAVLIFADILLINASYFLTAVLNNNHTVMPMVVPMLLTRALPVTVMFVLVYALFGLYSSIWKYAGMQDLLRCGAAGVMGGLLSVSIDKIGSALDWGPLRNMGNFDANFYVSSTLMIIALCGGFRMFYRASRYLHHTNVMFRRGRRNQKRIMLVGAGDMGMLMVRELEANEYRWGRPVVIVDDNPAKQGKRFSGIPVRGGTDRIPEIAAKFEVDEILFCIPSVSVQRQTEIMNIAMQADCVLKKCPTLTELNDDKPDIQQIRNVEITDLLPRPEVDLNIDQCKYLNGRTVLVTGVGSIGSEICRQVAKHKPLRMILVDNYENNVFSLYHELKRQYKDTFPIYIRIGSVQDIGRMREIFSEFHPDIVFHAAAHKHVPLMESSPCEAVKNNIFGTYNTAKVAVEHKVKKFVILSTDKAVNPANVMGATKRVTEMIVQYFDRLAPNTQFAAVRFGNVLGSNGSVIPIFKKQIECGGPVTVTDPEITRYFMTIPEAAQLVIQAGSLSQGGEVFVLDMGEPVRILDLAEKIIKLSGYVPYKDIDIVFTGLRPGEKLYEELTLTEEMAGRKKTANNKIFVTPPLDFSNEKMERALKKLRAATNENVRELLMEIVPNFHENPDAPTIE